MKRHLILALVALSVIARAQDDDALREQGVLYFAGNLPSKVEATIHTGTTVYLRRDFQTALAALYDGQKIELVGLAPEGYLVRTTYRNNTITGWIKAADLPSGVDPGVFAAAQKEQARRDAVAVAIANKTVVRGMTPDEVKLAIGKPEQVASREDAHGTSLTWIYTTYREEPQYEYGFDGFGHPVLQTYYVKIPIGQKIVTFANNAVAAIEDHKTDPGSTGIVTN